MSGSNIAQLGITVDSSQVTGASAALKGLTAAAAPAASAVASLTNAAKPAAAATAAMATASKSAASAHGGLSTQAMAAGHSVRSAIESIVAGTSPMQALALQLNHLSYAASGPQGISGAFSEMAGTLTKFINPSTLVVGGLVGIGVAAAVMLDKLKNSELEFGALADRTQTSVSALHDLQSAASFKGISFDDFNKGMAQFGTLTSEAKDGLGSMGELFRANGVAAGTLTQNFSSAADLIKNASGDAERYRLVTQLGLPPTREWVELLKQGSAGISAATDQAQHFSQTADEKLIQRARDFDDAWNKTWTNFANGAKSGAVSAIDAISSFGETFSAVMDKINKSPVLGAVTSAVIGNTGRAILGSFGKEQGTRLESNSPVDSFYKGIDTSAKPGGNNGTGNNGQTVDPNVLKQNIANTNALIGALGGQASVTQLVTQKTNELTLANLAGAGVSKDQVASILEHTRADALGLTAIQASIDAQRVQAMTQDMGVGPAAAYAAVQDRINAAVRAGQPLNAAEIAQLRAKAGAYGDLVKETSLAKLASDQSFSTSQLGRTDNEAAVAAQLKNIYGTTGPDDYTKHLNDAVADQIRLNQALTDTKSLAQNALSGFVKDLVAGKSASEALRGSLQTIESKLIDMATNALISNLFKSLIGAGLGGGGLFSSGSLSGGLHHTGGVVGSGEAGGSKSLPMSVWAAAPRFHTGGLVSGEVPIIAKAGESILTPAQMKMLTPVGSGQRSGGGNNVQVVVNNNASGTDVQTNSRKEGGVDIHEITISAVGDAMASGRFDGPMRARYSQQVKPRSR